MERFELTDYLTTITDIEDFCCDNDFYRRITVCHFEKLADDICRQTSSLSIKRVDSIIVKRDYLLLIEFKKIIPQYEKHFLSLEEIKYNAEKVVNNTLSKWKIPEKIENTKKLLNDYCSLDIRSYSIHEFILFCYGDIELFKKWINESLNRSPHTALQMKSHYSFDDLNKAIYEMYNDYYKLFIRKCSLENKGNCDQLKVFIMTLENLSSS